MLKKYSLKALQKAINKALSLDPNLPQKLQAFEGKTLEIILAPLSANFYFHFSSNQIILQDSIDKPADTTIHSSPIGLIRLSFLPQSKARSIFNDSIRISGDLEFGQNIKQLFDSIDIDWEGHLAQFTGDVVAHQIGSFLKKGKAFTEQVQQSFKLNVSEYLQEEFKLSPSREELQDFFADIDTLMLDTERLEAKIQLLMACDEIN